jgi:hypothetical protein
LKYGDIELLYEPGEDALSTIHMEGFGIPHGSSFMQVDPWIIAGGLAMEDAERALKEAGIVFTHRPLEYDPNMAVLITLAGVELGFVTQPDACSPLGLYYVAKRARSNVRATRSDPPSG